jgi:hypothetical protein
MNTTTVTIETAGDLLVELVKVNQPVMLWGTTGIGKSDLMGQVAKRLGIGFRTFIGSIKTPVDLGGIPVPDLKSKTAVWLRPTDLPTVERDGPKGLFFLDEINTCAPSMQAAMFQLVLERRVGEHELPEGWVPVAAGNRISDRAAAQRMPTALRNRFAHLNVEPDVGAWTKWAAGAGVDQYLIAFLNFRKALLHVLPAGDENAFPSPRAWAQCNKFMNLPSKLRQPLVASLVGEGPAAELEGFLRVVTQLPTLKEILNDPFTAKAPTDPAGKYAASALLARSVDRKNLGTLLEYAKRLGREFEVLTVVDSVKRQPDLTNTGEFGAWAVANQDVRL